MSAIFSDSTCTARFAWGLGYIVTADCDQRSHHPGPHSGNWHHGFGEPGITRVTWDDNDRRSYHGAFTPCPTTGCVLPGGHRGDHAQ